MKIIAVNKSASFEYFIEEKYEAGVVLEGSEVKSLRAGRASLGESFCEIRGGEIFLKNMHVALYDKSGAFPRATRARTASFCCTKPKFPKSSGG